MSLDLNEDERQGGVEREGDKGGIESERWMGIREREEDEGERERETKKNCFSIKIIYYHLMKFG